LAFYFPFGGIHLLRPFAKDLPDAENIHMDGRVLLFAVGLSVLTALLFGLAPADRALRPSFNDALREGESRTSTGRHGLARYLLVVFEVALAMVLLIGAGLMINSLLRMLLPSPGFDRSTIRTAAMKVFGFVDDTSQKRTAATDWTNGNNTKCCGSNCLEGARQPP
jgi:hypothetical protein